MTGDYRLALAKPGAARLLGTALLGRMPQGMSSLAVLLLVRAATHSYAAAGAAVGAGALASAVCGPILGRLIDRFGRRPVVGSVAGVQACVYLGLALAARDRAPAGVLILGAGMAGGLVPPIAPVVRTVLRGLYTEPRQRETAYSMDAIAQETIWIVGPLIATVVITVASPVIAVAMLGGIGVAGTALFLRSPLLAREQRHARHDPGRAAALSNRDLRWLLAPVSLMGFGLGAVEVGLPSLALHDGARAFSGLLLALWSLGSMAGGLRYGARGHASALGSRYAVLLLANCVFTLPLLLAGPIVLSGLCSFVAGLAVAPVFSCQYSLIGHTMVPGGEHEAFGWALSALVSGVAAGSALAGAVIAAVGVRGPFMLAVLAAALAALAALRFRGRFGRPVAAA